MNVVAEMNSPEYCVNRALEELSRPDCDLILAIRLLALAEAQYDNVS